MDEFRDKEDGENKAKEILSYLTLVANLLLLPLSCVYGYLCDKFKIWYLNVGNTAMVVLFSVILVLNYTESSAIQSICYVGLIIFTMLQNLLVRYISLNNLYSLR